ncbi:FAD-dependent oxidoreductase [Parasphingorhabdus sp.]|uniref:NAD(P)/FAD-dependent oxidoreductase n=1 Tax=Parasphingorhabdus sp. TaxID=2709688 RepID=UPI0032EE650B
MSEDLYDVAVIGGGIAGASIAAELSSSLRVLLIEAEEASGYHATGRSAAAIGSSYGNAVIRELTERSLHFFMEPPSGFSEVPLVRKRPWLFIGTKSQQPALDKKLEESPSLLRITADAVRQAAPLLSEDYCSDGALDQHAMDVDVDALTQGYLRLLRRNNGDIRYSSKVSGLVRTGGHWRVEVGSANFQASMIVNAAGAWADQVALAAGLPGMNLVPMRRTAILVDPPVETNLADLPLVMDIEENFYFKPEAGLIMISPADETPVEPYDAQAEEYEVALAAHHFEMATGNSVRHVRQRWAGLRTFSPDRSPVVGMDPRAEGFFWFAGQGGYGVQTAPALAKLAASLLSNNGSGDTLSTALSPTRFAADPVRVD